MNIAVFIKKTTFHRGYGGLETQNKNLCEGLVDRGHPVTVFSPKLDALKEDEELNGVRYVFVDCSFRSLAGFAFWDKNNWVNKSVERFKVLNDSNRFDVVLGQSSAALGIIKQKGELKIKVISISHGTAAGEIKTQLQNLAGIKNWILLIPNIVYFLVNFFKRQREFVLHSDKIIAVSKAVKHELIDETFIPEKRVEVVYNGVNLHGAESDNVENDIDVLYVGQVIRPKGVQDLVEALGTKNISVGIVGDGDYLEEMKVAAGKNFEFFGRLDQDAVYKVMRRARIFVLPSHRWEGLPMTLVESAFLGLPAVGSSIGGIPEVIEDGKTGFVYEVGNVVQLQERISRLLADSDLRLAMGQAARERAHGKFSLDKMLDGYEKVFREVLE